MTTLTIENATPDRILRKEAFKRIKPSDDRGVEGVNFQEGKSSASYNPEYNPLVFNFLTQADFMREFDVNAHPINHLKEYPDQFLFLGTVNDKAARNKFVRKVQTRVAMAWQQYILTKRVSTLTGNNIDLSIANAESGKDTQGTLALFQEGWTVKGVENAVFKAIKSDLKVGDTAIVFHKDGGEVGWRTYAYDKGDLLFPHYDPMTGKLSLFGRKYSVHQTNDKGELVIDTYLDVWDNTYYARYKEVIGEKTRGWIKDQEPKRHNFPFIPVAYHRYGEPCWAASQGTIEKLEIAMSQLAENNAQYALRILMLMGGDIGLEASVDGTPMVINSSDPNSKAGFLEPADSSNSFALQLTEYKESILRFSFVVKTPDIKSGSDLSSLTVKMLFAESFQKALDDAQEYQGFLDDVVRIFKEGYGTEIGKIAEFNTLKVKAEILPYIFMSETEIVNSLVQLVGIGALSRRSASEIAYRILGYGTIDEADRRLQEAHDELVAQGAVENEINNARQQVEE